MRIPPQDDPPSWEEAQEMLQNLFPGKVIEIAPRHERWKFQAKMKVAAFLCRAFRLHSPIRSQIYDEKSDSITESVRCIICLKEM